MRWHQKSIDIVLEELNTSPAGISSAEAATRFGEYGPNELGERKKRTFVMMFLDQFKDVMILVLIGAAVTSGLLGELSDTIAIIVIVVINAVIGFVQEFRAEKAMEALKKMAGSFATLLRDGKPATVSAAEIVPGDIVILEAGSIVPADLRITEAANLKVDESALTGESVPVDKLTNVLHDEGLPIGDRKNRSYKGTFVTYGRGIGVVTSTGMNTELGKIAAMLQGENEVKTPLQKRLAAFGRKLAIAVLAICVIVFVAGILRGEGPLLMLLTAISLAVAAIPEALPAVITISLALGAKELVKQNALIRKLPAVETLGSVTYICSDKTGTLTLNKMSVEKIYVDGSSAGARKMAGPRKKMGSDPLSASDYFMAGLALSNDARMDGEGSIIGDPTETALYAIARQNGFDKKELEMGFPRVAEIPFDSDRKCMSTFHKWHPADHGPAPETEFISFTKGALDVLIENSVDILTSRGTQSIDIEEINSINESMAMDGMRVICLCMRKWAALPEHVAPENVESGLTIIGSRGHDGSPAGRGQGSRFHVQDGGDKAGDDNRRPPPYRTDHRQKDWNPQGRLRGRNHR